jgi:hypothetical protein
MSAVVVEDLEINQGEDWAWEWTVEDPVTGDPMDISSWTGKGQIRPFAGSSTLLYEWTSTGGGANMTLGEDGKARISVPRSVSTAWTWGPAKAVYDIELTGGGKTVRLAQGEVKLSLEVTI